MTFSKGIEQHLADEKGKPTEKPRFTGNAGKPPSQLAKNALPDHPEEKLFSEVKSTFILSQFKMINSNREVDKAHVKRLVAAIKTKNLLHLNPIVVNKQMEVIDGQHRLAAAKILKTAIFYIEHEDITQDDIAGMNSNKKNWGMMDYINFYAVKGQADFIAFNKFCNKHNHLKPSLLQTLCSADGKRNGNDLREGKIDISNIEAAEKLISYIRDFKQYTPLAESSRFVEALRMMFNTGKYDHERMIKKVQMNSTALVPCANNRQYVQLLQTLYNRGVRDENIVLFIKR